MGKQQKMDPQGPLREGEFRRIDQIAIATEQALHKSGIETFDQLARLSPEEIAAALPGQVGVKERAIRYDWAGQAAEFAARLKEPNQQLEEEKPHYESFTVRLLLDEKRAVRYTEVTRVQGGAPDKWSGWDPDKLANWIIGQVHPPEEQPASPSRPEKLEKAPHAPARPSSSMTLSGEPQFHDIHIVGVSSRQMKSDLRESASFLIRLNLDLTEVKRASQFPLGYEATVIARKMGGWKALSLGQYQGAIPTDEPQIFIGPLPGLSEGSYHLEIAILVYPTDSKDPEIDGVRALTEGILVRVLMDEVQPA